MNVNHSQFLKKLHTEKSVIIQQYQPIYPAVISNIVINQQDLENVAHVLYEDGRAITLQGAKSGIDFNKLEPNEICPCVVNILRSMEVKQQEQLWQDIGLDNYARVHPIEGSRLPYFVLSQNEHNRFAYCPIATEKYAVLAPDDSGNQLLYSDLNYAFIQNRHLDHVEISSILCEYELAAVWTYEEQNIFKRIEQMTQETNARLFVFNPSEIREPIVSLPDEVSNYLTPQESKLAEKLVVLQENSISEPVTDETLDLGIPEGNEEVIEDFEPEMSM